MAEAVAPVHHNFDSIQSAEELKLLCPAFTQGCPFSKKNEVQSLTFMNDNLKNCPAFVQGCPFSSKSREEIVTFLKTVPKDHPPVNAKGQLLKGEDLTLLGPLNAFIEHNMPDLMPKEQMKPFSDELRGSITYIHKVANNNEFIKRLLRGEINVDEFGRYVTSLYFIYKHMEGLLDKYKNHPVVNKIHFPKELNRTESLTQDLKQIYGADRFAQVSDDATMTPALKEYISYMYDTVEKNPALLVAHSYTRYLGDLAGGQIISSKVKKNLFNIEENDTSCFSRYGLSFCIFENIGNHNEFKTLYRDGLNAINMTKGEREMIIQATLDTFHVNINMLNEVDEYSIEGKLVPTILEDPKKRKLEDDYPLNSQYSSTIKWINYAAISALAISAGISIYKRYTQN